MEAIAFRPRARLLLQLGDQLIKNESVAMMELIKNSYDADANKVDVVMKNINDINNGEIVIRDDGIGMNLDIIKNVWMEPGSDFKEKQLKANKRSPKHQRLPIGEKGVGRFGAHKLGYEIELVSKKEGYKEVYLKINWNIFQNPRYLSDVPIDIQERTPSVFLDNSTGTQITVRQLKFEWTRAKVRELYRGINALCSPFDAPDSFSVNFEIDEDKQKWLSDLLTWEKVKESALYIIRCVIQGNQIKSFRYEFKPWASMEKLKPRTITEKDDEISKIKTVCRIDRKKNPETIDLEQYDIGTVTFEAYIFDRDASTLRLGIQDKKGLKEYLDSNGGIKVYRDKIRVYDYGEPGNDWLDLDERRFNTPGKKISNNLVIASININRESSSGLIEKTNREGFIENDSYSAFRDAILYVLNQVENFRYIDKEQVRLAYGITAKSEPVLHTLGEIKETIEKRVKDKETKAEFYKYLNRVESEYKYINETLLRSAGAGLSLSVVIHEVEKVIDILQKVVNTEKPSKRIIDLVKRLSDLVDGYSEILKNPGKKNENLTKIIDQAIFNIEYRLGKHSIDVIKEYSDLPKELAIVKCSKSLLLSTILNILDNSIWWLKYSNVNPKNIYVSITKNLIVGSTCLLIADNGPGFSLPPEQIIKPFVSAKPNGIGLGLHIANETMIALGGKLIFPEWGDTELPDEYKNGAIIAFCFEEEK